MRPSIWLLAALVPLILLLHGSYGAIVPEDDQPAKVDVPEMMGNILRVAPHLRFRRRAVYKALEEEEHTTTEESGSHNESHSGEHEHVGVHVASWRWDEVGLYVTITGFVILSGLAKVGFHHLHWLSSRIPESCLLVVVGVACGGLIVALGWHDEDSSFQFPEFSPELFFFALLPPIILEAAYSLYDKAFFDNLPTILVMAVIGTAFNFLVIGFLLYGVYAAGAMGTINAPFNNDIDENVVMLEQEYDMSLVEVLTYASLISAVDPVAVLAIFAEVGVNPDLYFLLFGESLLNDGVAVVLYNMMNAFAEIEASGQEISGTDIGLGLVSFITVAFGGLLVGIIIGLLTALITRTTTEVRVVEPLACLGMGYFAYVMAELFHWSGIISLIGCGLIQAHYAFPNISKNSYITVKYFIKMLSATSDCVIFLFLGIALVEGPHYWHTGFTVWTIAFTLIVRFVGVYMLLFLCNFLRIKKVNLQEQFITAYGGLRGAVGFSLVSQIDPHVIPPATMFVTTTLAVVVFTVFFQGGTMKFMVNLLSIDKASEEQRKLCEEIHDTVTDHVMVGIEIIAGKRGTRHFGKKLVEFDEKVMKKVFCKKDNAHEMFRLLEDITVNDHIVNLYGPTILMDPTLAAETTEFLQKNAFDEEDERIHRSPLMSDASGVATLSATQARQRSASVISALLHADQTAHEHIEMQERTRRRSRMNSVTSGSEGRKVSLASDREVLHHAFKTAPYQNYHKKYNPNLIHDEDQELETHLRRRRSQARRISQIAMNAGQHPSQGDAGSLEDSELGSNRSRALSMGGRLSDAGLYKTAYHGQHRASASGPVTGVDVILQRQNERARSISVTSGGSDGHYLPKPSPPLPQRGNLSTQLSRVQEEVDMALARAAGDGNKQE